ncbi:MAG: aminotransferase class I/II-fold pyridoxal phosphate-dependent enzyme [Legionella sp.]
MIRRKIRLWESPVFSFFDDQYAYYQELKERGLIFFELPFETTWTHTELYGQSIVSFASNDYLIMVHDPGMRDVYIQAVSDYGSGAGSSMIGSVSLKIHRELCDDLADFLGKEVCILFPTGYSAMLSFCAANMMNGAVILADDASHRCILDGCKLGNGYVNSDVSYSSFYQHNSLSSLQKRHQQMNAERLDAAYQLIFTEGVFSTNGYLGNLKELSEFCRRSQSLLAVDDAHGIGVLGEHGRGTANHLGVEYQVDFILGTFSKTFATTGGFLARSKDKIDYLRLISGSYLYSASLSPASFMSVKYVLNALRQNDTRQNALWGNIELFKSKLAEHHFDFGDSASAIVPVFIRDTELTIKYCRALLDNQFFAVGFIAPGVPKGPELIRFSINAGHTQEEIEALIACLVKIRDALEA